MFNGMLDAEAKLRKNPDTKSARLRFMEFGGPKPVLQWSMEAEGAGRQQGAAADEDPQ